MTMISPNELAVPTTEDAKSKTGRKKSFKVAREKYVQEYKNILIFTNIYLFFQFHVLK